MTKRVYLVLAKNRYGRVEIKAEIEANTALEAMIKAEAIARREGFNPKLLRWEVLPISL